MSVRQLWRQDGTQTECLSKLARQPFTKPLCSSTLRHGPDRVSEKTKERGKRKRGREREGKREKRGCRGGREVR